MAQRKKSAVSRQSCRQFVASARVAPGERETSEGEISAAQLRDVEDRCIRDAVKMQEDVGMQGITDGEFRRTLWHADFLSQFDGIKVVEGSAAGIGETFSKPRLRRAAFADPIRRYGKVGTSARH